MKRELVLASGFRIKLSEEKTDGPVWVQVCLEGQYKGHSAAPVVDFSRATFDKIVANFRSHPSYKAGADGFGSEKVVPYDYEHASEADPTSGTIPVEGAPACGWILELAVREGESGRAELWALSEFLPEAREQVQTGKYRWTSVAVAMNATDGVTGKKIGPVLSSVALTNHPFVQGMQPIAARRGATVTASVSVYDGAESPEEMLVGLRSVFRLDPNATAETAMGELEKYRRLVASGMQLPEYLMSVDWQIRELAGQPVMATIDEIVGAIGEALSSLLPRPASSPSLGETAMSVSEQTIKLSKILKCAAGDSEVEAAAKDAKADSDLLSQVREMFGGGPATELSAKVAKAVSDAAKLAPLQEAMASLQAALKKKGEEEADEEAEMVATSSARGTGDPEKVKKQLLPAIRAARRSCIKDDGCVDEQALAKFREDFPISDDDRKEYQRVLLSKKLFATPEGTQLGGVSTGLDTRPVPDAPTSGGQKVLCSRAQRPTAELISTYPGRNDIERSMAYLSANHAEFKNQFNFPQDQVRAASKWLKTGAY